MHFFILFGISFGLSGIGSLAHGFEPGIPDLLQKAVKQVKRELEDQVNKKIDPKPSTSETRSADTKNSASETKSDSRLNAVAQAGDETQWKNVLKKHPDFKLVEKGYSGKLDSTSFVDVKIQQGAYYAFRVRLAPGSRWRIEPALGIPALPQPGREPMPTTIGSLEWGPSEAIFRLGPIAQTAQISVAPVYSMRTEDGSNLGTGSYTMEVYKRAGSDAERKKDDTALAKYREQSAKERATRRQETCSLCASEFTQADRKICLQRRGLEMGDCGW